MVREIAGILDRMAVHWNRLLLAAILISAPLANLAAAEYPSRPLRLLVPFPPGGGVDLIARVIGSR